MRYLKTLRHLSFAFIAFGANANDARDLYSTHCSSCHGERFQGTNLGPALSPDSYIYGGKQKDFIRVIKNGIASQGMPSFQNRFNEIQLSALADYLPERVIGKDIQQESKAAEKLGFNLIPGTVSTLDYLVNIEVLADGLTTPWALAFVSADIIFVTERTGSLRLIKNGQLIKAPIKGTPNVLVSSHKWNQGGLLDIAIDPNYKKNGWMYLCYSHAIHQPENKEVSIGLIRVARGKIKDHRWTEEEIIYEMPPSGYDKNVYHYGGRMLFDKRGYLYFSVGDRGLPEQAREASKASGKIHRLHTNGVTPKDNPYYAKSDALPSIFSIGHRNPQGLALHPKTGKVWASEHGPRGGDELNILKPAGDYGWPIVSYGISYDGSLLTPHTKAEGVEQPALYWRPSIAVSGITFYQGNEFPLWNDKLLVTGLKTRELRLLTVDKDRVQHQETLIKFEGRPYEPVVGPEGAIYVVLDSPGQLLRITALNERKI